MLDKQYFMKVAKLTSDYSTCARIEVGAVLVKENRIISVGYNGVRSGKQHCKDINWPKDLEQFKKEHGEWSQLNEFHAEANILSNAAKNGISTNDTELFVTLSPCVPCARMIINSGVKKVFFHKEYDRDIDGIYLLINNDVDVEQII